jgi:ABC-type multidrug transport system fused ATPase/permease subunit
MSPLPIITITITITITIAIAIAITILLLLLIILILIIIIIIGRSRLGSQLQQRWGDDDQGGELPAGLHRDHLRQRCRCRRGTCSSRC